MEQHRRCFAPTTGHRAVLEEEDVDALYIDEKDSFCEDVKIHLKKRERSEKADATTTASTATTGTLETYKRSTSTLDFLL